MRQPSYPSLMRSDHLVPPSTTTAPGYFGAMVDSYDSLIRRAIPRYDEMVQRLLDHIRPGAQSILELGCGTGNLTLALLGKFNDARITTVDASPEMTDVTMRRAREQGLADRLSVVTARFEDLDLKASSFDLVASSMSLHHVRDKQPLYDAIARWLRRDGELAFADQLAGATPHAHQAHWDLWEKFCREPGHCTEEEIASLTEHSRAHDHYVTAVDHFQMLARSGFRSQDVVWRTGMYSVVTAEFGSQ
jgi:tRNA (cmo5U34)-methyltransferase